MTPRVKVTATTAPAMTPASLELDTELELGDGSLRDTVTGDEKSPPPTDVTACTCEHDTQEMIKVGAAVE